MREIYRRPPDYIPPSSATEFQERYRRGERYFEGAQLTGQDAGAVRGGGYARVNLRGADLAEADLRRLLFEACDFTGANCRGTVFDHSRFFRCSFALADLRGAWLYHVGFAFVNLLGADLRGAHYLDTRHWVTADYAAQVARSGEFRSCFVSYANADRAGEGGLVRAVSERLTRVGAPHWFQPYSSWSDVDLSAYFRREIAHCDVFALLLTPHVAAARGVRSEVSAALSLNAKTGRPELVTLAEQGIALPEAAPYDLLAGFEVVPAGEPPDRPGINRLLARLRRR